MGLVTLTTTFVDGTIPTASQFNGNFNDLVNEFNGNIGSTNVDSSILTTNGIQTPTNKTINGDNNTLTNLPAANLKISSQAQGDLLYASSASAWARLGPGTSGQVLTTQGAGANPTWASAGAVSSKVVSFTRDISTTGTQAITGAGFTPTAVIVFGGLPSTAALSWGAADSASTERVVDRLSGGNADNVEAALIFISTNNTTTYASAVHTSWDADGMTITWSKTGSPTGTAEFIALFLK